MPQSAAVNTKWNQSAFAERLTFACNQRKLALGDLAEKVGVSPSTMSCWRTQPKHNPPLDKIITAAKVLDVSPAWLAFGDIASMFGRKGD